MKRMVTVLCAITLFPSIALGAGFAKQSLFLSKSAVMEGETVLVHTIVSNESSSKFAGTLTLTEEEKKIGTVPVTLGAQEAQAISISWKPAAGSHPIVATLTDSAGEAVEKQSATFHINEKPKPASEGVSGDISSSADLQNQLAGLSPGAAQVAAPLFSTLDSFRGTAAGALDNGIEWAKKQVTPKKSSGTVLGSSTKEEDRGILGTLWFILATIALHVFSILRYIVANAGIFYPAFAVLFFYTLWRIYKRMRRPKFESYD